MFAETQFLSFIRSLFLVYQEDYTSLGCFSDLKDGARAMEFKITATEMSAEVGLVGGVFARAMCSAHSRGGGEGTPIGNKSWLV